MTLSVRHRFIIVAVLLIPLGVAYLRLGRFDEAVTVLERRAVMGHAEKALVFLGEAEARRGNHERAIQLYKSVLEKGTIEDNLRADLRRRIENLSRRK